MLRSCFPSLVMALGLLAGVAIGTCQESQGVVSGLSGIPPMTMPCWSGSPCTNQCYEQMANLMCQANTGSSTWQNDVGEAYCSSVAQDITGQFSTQQMSGYSVQAWQQTCGLNDNRTSMIGDLFQTVGGALFAAVTKSTTYETIPFDDPRIQGLLSCLCPSSTRGNSNAYTANYFTGVSCQKAKKVLRKNLLIANTQLSNPLARVLWAYANSKKLSSMGQSQGTASMTGSDGMLTPPTLAVIASYNQQLGASLTNPYGFAVGDGPSGPVADASLLHCETAYQDGNDPFTILNGVSQ